MNYKEIVFKNILNIMARISRKKHSNLPNKENPVDFTGPCRFHFNSNNKVSMKFSKAESLKKIIKEKDKFIYQGIVYNIKTSKVIKNFHCPLIYYSNQERDIILPQKPLVIYKCLYQSVDSSYFILFVYDSGEIKIASLDATAVYKLMENDIKNKQSKSNETVENIQPEKIGNSLPDLTQELTELMVFISRVSIDIRMYSAYNSSSRIVSDPNAPYDLMYLSEILHNLSMFHDDKIANIIYACDFHINTFEHYLVNDPYREKDMKGNPVETFKRHSYYVNLNKAIEIFKRIKAKCTAATWVL